MNVVRTVLGDIPPSSLGHTLVHDHLIQSTAPFFWRPGDAPEFATAGVSLRNVALLRAFGAFAARDNLALDDVGVAVSELAVFARLGGTGFVDATPSNSGRDVRALEYIAKNVPVHIVASSGHYMRKSHPAGFDERSERSIATEYIHELREGVGETGIRTGAIKIGVGQHPIHPVERKTLRAAVRAQKATGSAILVHPAVGPDSPLEIARIVGRAGADMTRVEISHMDERFRGDVSLFRRLPRDIKVGFDTFGREHFFVDRGRQHPSDADRILWLTRLLDAGFEHRVTLGHDVGFKMDLTEYGGTGYGHILRDILPRMIRAGISQSLIDLLTVTNPASLVGMDG